MFGFELKWLNLAENRSVQLCDSLTHESLFAAKLVYAIIASVVASFGSAHVSE